MGSVFGTVKNEEEVTVKKAKVDPRKPYFRMPLYYPRYRKADYEAMPEETLDILLRQYGLPVTGTVFQKRDFAVGAFIFPEQLRQEEKEEEKQKQMEKCSLTEPCQTQKQ